MRTISLLSICIILITAGCTTFREPMMREARTRLEVVGCKPSPNDPNTYLTPGAAYKLARNEPLLAVMWNIDTSEQFSDNQSFATVNLMRDYGINPQRQTVNIGELCWKDHPIRWPVAVAADKGGPYLLITGGAAGVGWGISELVDGGGGDSDSGKKETTINGDGNTVTYYENDGDVGVDSHDYSGPAAE